MALDSRIVVLVGAETAILDESSYARTLTAVGNAARTTAQFKYGAASLTFDGAGDWVQAADSADFTFGSGDFTVEGWFRFVTKANSQAMLGQWDNVGSITNCSWFFFITGGNLTLRLASGAGTVDVSVAWTPTLGQWYHLAADRRGTTVRVYRDGVVVATNASYSATLNDSNGVLTLGAVGTTGSFLSLDFNGQMDEVRLTKGLAQYAGAFTPPTTAFPRATLAERTALYVCGPV